jgi:hypothetical protein
MCPVNASCFPQYTGCPTLAPTPLPTPSRTSTTSPTTAMQTSITQSTITLVSAGTLASALSVSESSMMPLIVLSSLTSPTNTSSIFVITMQIAVTSTSTMLVAVVSAAKASLPLGAIRCHLLACAGLHRMLSPPPTINATSFNDVSLCARINLQTNAHKRIPSNRSCR